jgi:hypothetical protein
MPSIQIKRSNLRPWGGTSAFALLSAGCLMAGPVLQENGDLHAFIDAFPIPGEASPNKYRLPTEPELIAFRTALGHILEGDLQAAADAAVEANYDVVSFNDNVSADVFALLREKNSNPHWGGLYVIDLTPERALVVQCPHPIYDGVRVPSADIFINTQAVALLLAGTHRNNSPVESDCDGELEGSPYRISDMAHAPDSFFQAAHEVIEDHFTRSVSLSFHGMAEDTDPADVVVSNGTGRIFRGNSLSSALAARMNQILADAFDPRVAVSHQEPGSDPALSGSNNTQGRFTNGSPDLCHADAPNAVFPERFIHMENDPDVRSGPASNWAFITQALNEKIPLFSEPDPGLPVGKLAITELMPNPTQVGDVTGEYIELFNQTGAPIDMTGWFLTDRQGNTATFSGVIHPGDLFVVGVSGDLNGGQPGGAPDAVWLDTIGDFTLTDTGDTVTVLDAGGNPVTSANYEDGNTFGTGVAHELSIGNAHPKGQTTDAHTIAAIKPFGTNAGSPGTRGGSQFPLSPLRLTTSLAGQNPFLTIGFSTQPAVTHRLWHSADLVAEWLPVPGIDPLVGSGAEASFIIPLPGEPAGFHRIGYGYTAPE